MHREHIFEPGAEPARYSISKIRKWMHGSFSFWHITRNGEKPSFLNFGLGSSCVQATTGHFGASEEC